MKGRIALCVLMCGMFIGTSGCLTLGPRVKTVYVVARPGNPGLIVQNRTLKLKTESGEIVKTDVGGWYVMPREHWEVIRERILEDHSHAGQ